MQQEDLSILRSLKQNIDELVAPLEAAQVEFYGATKENMQRGLDFIMGELTMMVVLFTGTDSSVSPRELELLNAMRRVVYGEEISELSSNDYLELCREFLRAHPERRMTVDHLPSSIKLLLVYDRAYGTEYADKARILFTQVGEALVRADNNEHPAEAIILVNFKAILNAE